MIHSFIRFTLAALLFGLVIQDSTAQSVPDYSYHWGHPAPQGNMVYNFAFANDLTGWAVTGCGTVLKTSDGGQQWEIQMLSDSCNDLYDIILLENNILIASGANGTILRSVNEGVSWTTITNPMTGNLYDLALIPGGGISAAGENGAVLVSYDEGLNWEDIGPDSDGYARCHVWLNDTVAFIAGDQLFYRTQDGGNSWDEIGVSSGLGFNEIFFIDENTGYVLDDFVWWETNDRGETWSELIIPNQPLYRFRTLILDEQHWFAVSYGEGGELWETLDGGTNWQQHFFQHTVGFPCLTITSANRLIFGSDVGDIFYSDDGGQTIVNSVNNLSKVPFAPVNIIGSRPDGVLFAANAPSSGLNNETFYRSDDDGMTWYEPSVTPGLHRIIDMQFIDNQHGILGAYNDIRYTTDGGETWNASQLPADYRLSSFALPSGNNYFAATYTIVGNGGGNLYRSQDRGDSWELVGGGLPGGNVMMTNVSFADANTGYVTGHISLQPKLYKTTDGGSSWSAINFSGISDVIADMNWQTKDIGLAVVYTGNYGIFRTEDGGNTWTKVSDLKAAILSKTGGDRIAALYRGDSYFQESLDGGINWTTITPPFSSLNIGYKGDVEGIAITADGYIIGGDANRLLKAYGYIPTGIEPIRVNQERVNNAEIITVSPNPVKTHMNVRFLLREAGLADITLFDSEGRKIRTLLHKKLNAGEHEYSFSLTDAGGSSSGTCYISLSTNSGFDVEKIILVK